MRRFLLALCVLCGSQIPTTSGADLSATYKGQFEFAAVDLQPITPHVVFVREVLEGVETLLGKFHGEVFYIVDPISGVFSGSLTKRGSDGDTMTETVSGQFTPTGSFGKFKVTGGSGRFENATGGGNFYGTWTNAAHTAAHIGFDATLSRRKTGNLQAEGIAFLTNLQGATQVGGLAPYYGTATSPALGKNVQTGSIHNTTGLMPIDATTLVFEGSTGPNPFMAGAPKIHLIQTDKGVIYCTWTAVFTLKVVSPQGDAVLSGDGSFTILGGTGKYEGASGTFATLFETQPVPAGSTGAYAKVQQFGHIDRK